MQNKDIGETKGKFWIVIGDIHDQTGNIARIPDLDQAQGIIISGDLTQLGGCPEAKKVLNTLPDLPVYAQIGNMDKPEIDTCLNEESKNLHGKAYELTPDIAILGIGGSTQTPFHTPSEFSEEQYATWLDEGWKQASRYSKQILISHNPPKDTACDKISSGIHVGSSAVRKFIEEKQPDLCICGHIHEAKSEDRIGNTLILNPGMLSDGSYVIIEEKDGKLNAAIINID